MPRDISCNSCSLSTLQDYCFLASEHVVDWDSSILGSGIDIALTCGLQWGEVASDEGFQNLVAPEGKERLIFRMFNNWSILKGVGLPSVIKARHPWQSH